MPRDLRARENQLRARARRESALKRMEIEAPTSPRRSAAGATSAPVKVEDPALRRLIDAALAKRREAQA